MPPNFESLNLTDKDTSILRSLGEALINQRYSVEVSSVETLKRLKELAKEVDPESFYLISAIKCFKAIVELSQDASLEATEKHLSVKGSKAFNRVMENAKAGDMASRAALANMLTFHFADSPRLLEYAPLLNDWLREARGSWREERYGNLTICNSDVFFGMVDGNFDIIPKGFYDFTGTDYRSEYTINIPMVRLEIGGATLRFSQNAFQAFSAFIYRWVAYLVAGDEFGNLKSIGVEAVSRPPANIRLNPADPTSLVHVYIRRDGERYYFKLKVIMDGFSSDFDLFGGEGLRVGEVDLNSDAVAGQLKELNAARKTKQTIREDDIWRAGLFLMLAGSDRTWS